MNSTVQTTLSRRSAALLLASSVLPVIAFMLIRQLGLLSLARLGVIGVAAAAVGLVMLTHPRLALYFMAVYLYANLRFYVSPKIAVVVIATITFAVVVDMVRGKAFRKLDGAFSWTAAMLLLVSLQSMMWAHDLSYARFGFSQLVKALLLTVLIAQLLETPDHLRAFGRWIFIGAVATIVLGVANLKLGVKQDINVFGGVDLMRFMGTHTNPNYAAAFMVSALPMGVFFVKHGRGVAVKTAVIVGIVALVIGIFSTFSRAALLSLSAVAVGVLVREVRSRKAYTAVFVILLAGMLLTPSFYWARILAIADLSQAIRRDWSFFLRFSAMSEAWELFLRHPWWGVGLNNFIVRSAGGLFVRIGPHNMYLELLSGLGIVGMLSYLAVQASAIRQMVSGWRHRWPQENRWLGDLSYHMFLMLISALISGVFADIEFHYLIWIPVGGALVISNLRKTHGAATAAGPSISSQ